MESKFTLYVESKAKCNIIHTEKGLSKENASILRDRWNKSSTSYVNNDGKLTPLMAVKN